jgi:hypothetical protein
MQACCLAVWPSFTSTKNVRRARDSMAATSEREAYLVASLSQVSRRSRQKEKQKLEISPTAPWPLRSRHARDGAPLFFSQKSIVPDDSHVPSCQSQWAPRGVFLILRRCLLPMKSASSPPPSSNAHRQGTEDRPSGTLGGRKQALSSPRGHPSSSPAHGIPHTCVLTLSSMRCRQSHLAVLAVWAAIALAFWGQPAGAQNVSTSLSLSPSISITLTILCPSTSPQCLLSRDCSTEMIVR